ncbi:MAG TPA: MFS transporter [Candidatus Sulfomarinibacteraceae bacterium]|nr:MFS transporter [Candidatus Sulfomarinibacteraceae bacterium]
MPRSRFVPALLRMPDFRRFWIGQTISVIGDQVALVALPLTAVIVLQADAAQMGLLTAAALLPHLLFSLPAGVWLDRVPRRRRLMIAADLGRAILGASIPIAWLAGVLTLEQLFVVGFLSGSLSVVFDILWATIFVSVAPRERYVEGNTLLSGSRSIATVAGPTISGGLVQALGAPIAILVDAASFVASAFSLARIQSPEAPVEPDDARLGERLTAGLRFIFGDSIVRTTLLAAGTINFFNYGFAALFILYATTALGVSPGILGLVLGSAAVGGVVGAVIAAGVGRRLGLGRAFALGCVLFPAPLIIVPLVGDAGAPVILAGLFVAEFGAGIGVMILDVNVGAVLLARTPDRIRARAGGAFRFVNYGIRPIGALVGGLLGSTFGVRETLFVVTIGALLGGLWLIRSPILRLRDLPEAADG